MSAPNLLADDLDDILNATRPLWENLRDQSLFITGGTGFFGSWLLESLAFANSKLDLNVRTVILTRDKAAFATKCPHLIQQKGWQFHEGDIRNFSFPDEQFTYIIHAATEANATLNISQPLYISDTILSGTKHTLDFAKTCGAKQFLYVSSGAVYGKQPSDLTHISESYPLQPDFLHPASAYSVGKAGAEHMCCLYGNEYNFAVKIARCFAFVGPYLTLDGTYAIGNFIRDGLQGGPIIIGGDGTPYRSYLYAADLAIWLWTILFCGQSQRPYNVGSDEDYTIAEIAKIVAGSFHPAPSIKQMKQPATPFLPERYVPDVTRARTELQLTSLVNLQQAIARTKNWHLSKLALNKAVAS